MGHHISAIVTKLPIRSEQVTVYKVPIFIEGEFAIIALDPAHTDYWTEQLSLVEGEEQEIILDCAFTHHLARELGTQYYAIIETNYSGGVGYQAAVVYNNGNKQAIQGTDSINTALRLLGIQRKEGLDEFDSLHLRKYRSFDQYFEDYYE